MNKTRSIVIATITTVASIAVLLASIGCNNDINRSSAPVELLINTTAQPIQIFDIAASTSTACTQNVIETLIQTRLKNPATTNTTFLDVRLTRYHVSYVRTDGGKQIPAPVDRAMDLLVAAGATSNSALFHLGDVGFFDQAPFAALLPQNGGKDPDTGSPVIKLNGTLSIFGQTLAGDNVSASTTFPLNVCFNCGGCSP